MSEYPWNILGIEPTTDELAIRRAYARQLKQFRPDEDPEGFANLVRAREYALQRRFLHERDLPVTEGGADEAPANDTEATAPTGQSETDNSLGFSSRDYGATVALAGTDRFDAQAQAAAFAGTMKRLRELVLGTSAETAVPVWEENKTPERLRLWEPEEWCAVLSGLGELTFEQRRALRDFVVSEAVPQLDAPPVGAAALRRLIEDARTSAVVDLWETEFGIRHNQATLAQLCGTQAMLRYLDWVALAEQVPPLHKRSEAERHFIDRFNELLPPKSATAGSAPDEAWVPDRWEELFALVRQTGLEEATRCRELFAERLTAWLPDLPGGPLAELGAKAAPATIVERIEREFALTEHLNSPFVDDAGANRYGTWLVYARRMRAIPQRCAEGASAYHTAAGIPVVPPEDLALGALPDKDVQATLAQAQHDGRWRPKLDSHALFLPAQVLAAQHRLSAAIGLLVCEGLVWFWLALLATSTGLAIATTSVIAIRLLFAFTTRSMAVKAAIQRIERADRKGLVHPKERGHAIAANEPAAWLMVPITIAACLMAFVLFVALIGSTIQLMVGTVELLSTTKQLQNSAVASQWIQSGEKNIRDRKFKDAIADFTQAIEFDPGNEFAFRRRGEAFLAIGNLDKAIDDFGRATALDPKDAEAYLQRALAEWQLAVSIYLKQGVDRSLIAEITVRLTEGPLSTIIKKSSIASRFDLEALSKLEHSDPFKKSPVYQADRNQIPEVTVSFSVDRNGHLLSKSIEKSSGDSQFDAAALSILDRSGPLPRPPLPVVGAGERWNFSMRVVFRADPRGRRFQH